MAEVNDILAKYEEDIKLENKHFSLSFTDYMKLLNTKGKKLFRDGFQLIFDMVNYYVPEGINEYPDDPESINFVKYDFNKLFIRGSDNPFFADRLFSNRFMSLVKSFDHGAGRNKIYLFEGPPGSGKSTFLKNFLYRFERYMKTDEGEVYETVWVIDKHDFMEGDNFILQSGKGYADTKSGKDIVDLFARALNSKGNNLITGNNSKIVIPCPHHDNPILQIPKPYRKKILDEIIEDDDIKGEIFNRKKYKWLFKDEACTICSSIYEALIDKGKSPVEVLNMIRPRRIKFDRRLGEGISVYNAGDIFRDNPVKNPAIQKALDDFFGDSNKVKFVYSNLAKTNNGIYLIMDVKQDNTKRLLNLHGVISDGIHKVEDIEERIRSVFMGLINPQDKKDIDKIESFKDRIVYINIPYVLDYKTEVLIYKNHFGENINRFFLPGVLENFARVIIGSRLNKNSPGLKAWIKNPDIYKKYCDEDMLLLKMEIYCGIIPEWINESDIKLFDAQVRRLVIKEGEEEGFTGITGRQSINVFNDFISQYTKGDKLINMEMVYNFFSNSDVFKEKVSESFLKSLVNSYDYNVLQQVKESLYSYNRTRISKNMQNYIFAMNFDIGSIEHCPYTHQVVEVTENFLRSIEDYLLGPAVNYEKRMEFRKSVLNKYITKTTREIKVDKKKLRHTELYKELHEKYTRNLKNNVLDPFAGNENFRNAIKEYGTKDFLSHDKKIKKDVSFLIRNLSTKYGYTEEGAKEICIYVIDKELKGKFQEN